MITRFTLVGFALMVLVGWSGAVASVDTLNDTSQIRDAVIYSWEGCAAEETGEDCRRYNSGRVSIFGSGYNAVGQERRALFQVPGWNDTIPDSSQFQLYFVTETDATDRHMYIYPLTREFFEGDEVDAGVGNYPDPDSGVTWNHAYLDVGDGDSVLWTSPGGDYTTAVACTALVTGINQWFTFSNFNRILNYWDTSGLNYGFIIINANEMPLRYSYKAFETTESGTYNFPQLLLFTAGDMVVRRRRLLKELLCAGGQ